MQIRSALIPILMLALNSCVSTSIGNPEIVKQNNAKLARYEQGLRDPEDAVHDDQLRRLWRDKPELAALVGINHAKNIRIISIAAPTYPYWEAWARRPAEVSVSFVVGVDGKVLDARIFESSDTRFDQPALDAIKQFAFLPAEGQTGTPELAIELQPFHFRVQSRRK